MPASRAAGALVDAHLEALSRSFQRTFEALIEGIAPDDIIGFGVFSDVDGADITAAVNTKQDLAANLERYSDPSYSEDLPPEFSWERYLRWAIGEWPRNSLEHSPEAAEQMREIWDTIAKLREQAPANDRQYWPSIQYEAAWIAMGYAVEDGWFDKWPQAVRVFAVMDDDEDMDTRIRWLGDLNHERRDEVEQYVWNES